MSPALPPAVAGALCIALSLLIGFSLGATPIVSADLWLIEQGSALRANAELWIAFTRIGDAPARIGFAIVAVVLLLVRRRAAAAALLPLATLIETVLTSGLKLAFARPRPALLDHLDSVTSLSFPSGHAAHNMALWLLGALLLAPNRRWAVAAALVVPLLVGMSRVVLGVHWPSDVLAGWLFGGGVALLAASIQRRSGTNTPAAA
ncbi:undecaprenyl-diphosphatase [Sphingomonas zeicaulis]|uniref:phosphatase PAP2 family protein n=1 Tax=Sphingomonas zeicaulis TaxID=1632740 RepID=UPI003D24B9EE